MSSNSRLDVLRHIITVAQDLARSSLPTSSVVFPSSTNSLSGLLPDCIFPTPQPLTSSLVAIGLDFNTAERFSNAYIQAASRSKAEYEKQYERVSLACCQINQSARFKNAKSPILLRDAYLSSYTKTIQSWSSRILNEFAPQALRIKHNQRRLVNSSSGPGERKRPFNQNALPFLEAFFERIQRPTRSEKLDLAAKTDMEYKQINVWVSFFFQNRRNRSRKNSKELSKSSACTELPPELELCVAKILSEGEHSEIQSNSNDSSSTQKSLTLPHLSDVRAMFNLERPPHAYPSSYPPLCSYNPFPIGEDIRSFPTPWVRQTWSSHPKALHASIDVAQLSDAFDKLSLVDETLTYRTDRTKDRSKGYLGFVTAVPLVPLPALLTSTVTTPLARNPRSLTPQMFSLPSKPQDSPKASTSKLDASPTKKPILRRNLFDIHRRAPTSNSTTRHSVSAVMSETSASSIIPSTGASISPTSGSLSSLTSSNEATSGISTPFRQRPVTASASELPQSSSSMMSSSTSSSGISNVSYATHYQPYSTRRDPSIKRKVAALPKRTPSSFNSSLASAFTKSSSLPPSRSMPALSRMSSTSSINSVSSCDSNSPSSGESDGPLTPPLLSTGLPDLEIVEVRRLLNKPSVDRLSPIEDLQLDL